MTRRSTPDTLDVTMRPRVSAHVEYVEVDGEVVVWHTVSESLHLLDRNASVVFLLCDGVTPLRTTIDEMAEAYGLPTAKLQDDVFQCVSDLLKLDLLEATDGSQ